MVFRAKLAIERQVEFENLKKRREGCGPAMVGRFG